jgi:hypothetical protein
MNNKQKIYDFILHKIKHPVGCPKWAKSNKECECGLDEIRKLTMEEINGK